MYRSALRREAWFIALWSALAGGLAATTVLAFGPFENATGLRRLIADLPGPLIAFLGIGDLGTRSGFVDALLFGLIAPVAFLSFSIGFGTRAGVTLFHAAAATRPERQPGESIGSGLRPTLISVAALVSGAVLLGIATFGGVTVAASAAHESLVPARLASAVAGEIALGVAFGVGGLIAATMSGRAGLAALIATIAALTADTLNGIAPAVPTFGSLRYVSLVYYAEAGRPFTNGISIIHLGVLLLAASAIIAVAAGAATVAARRRAIA
jgi:ABC-2 type transport system permease protein